MENLFTELLQVSLGTCDVLSRAPSDKEWVFLMRMAEKQAILGVMACGIEKLPKEIQPPKKILLKWIGQTIQIEQRNVLASETS